jgi:methylated-DNA-[protein]-cysteine S-methyltransferase
VAAVHQKLRRYFNGVPQSFRDVPLQWEGIPTFHRRVYKVLQKIPAGQTVTYGELAALAGSPGAARAVGQAMAKNPFPIIIPCHRVVASQGRLGGFSSGRGPATKRHLLQLDGLSRHS